VLAETLLPSRILEIHRRNEELAVRLNASLTSDDKYIALSYCWGGGRNTPRLLLQNLADFERGISTTFFLKTFKDAVAVVNSLGYKYLWIDALCIIQNSDSDKAVEISKMQGIYRDSFLTIAAADGRDSHAGILSSRESVLSTQVRSPTPALQPTASVHLRTQRSSVQDVLDGQIPHPHLNGPLSSRAWTLQERILPRRVLHYCNAQLVWGVLQRQRGKASDQLMKRR
jgi:hypothetical protein